MLLFLLLCIVLDIINHQFWLNDFKVYYGAAENLKNGADIYGSAFGLGSGFFKYSPFAAMIFIPLTFLNYFFAEIFFCFLIFIATFYIFKWLMKNMLSNEKNTFLIPFFTLLVCAVHFQRELHLGNINLILIALLLFIFELIKSKKSFSAAIIYALVIAIKPHFIILLPLFLLRKKWKFSAFSICIFVVLLHLPILLVGFAKNGLLFHHWIAAMISHNKASEGNEQTIYFIFQHYFLKPLSIQNNSFFNLILLGIVALLISFAVIKNLRNERTQPELSERNFCLEYLMLIAIVPNLVITDTNHFLFCIPIIFILINHLFSKPSNVFLKIISILFLFLFGAKATGIIGNDLADVYLLNGMLGISNLAIILLGWKIEFDHKTILNFENK